MRVFVFVLVAATLALAVGLGRAGARPAAATSLLELSAPARVPAGTAAAIDVTADSGATVAVLFTGSYGATTHTVAATGGVVSIPVPFTEYAGRVDVIATAGDLEASAHLTVVAGPVAAPPTPFVGARSIVADGGDRTMVVAIPADRFGNPVPAGTGVGVEVTHPDRTTVRFGAEVGRTLAWTWVPSATTAGEAVVTASAAGMVSPGRTLREVPAAPVSFDVAAEVDLLLADGRDLVPVASGVLVDRHGNRLADGTAATLRADYADGTSAVQTVPIIGGVARATIQAPDSAGIVTVAFDVLGVSSPAHSIVFEAAAPSAARTGAATPPERSGR